MVVYYIPIIYNRVLYIQTVLVQYVDTSRVHFFGTLVNHHRSPFQLTASHPKKAFSEKPKKRHGWRHGDEEQEIRAEVCRAEG